MTDVMNTQEKILHFGKKEFLQKGFKNASLRNISAAANMTTGAIYTYFKDKNALFEAIVEPVCLQVEEMFRELSALYYNDNSIVSEITTENSIANLREVYRFIYDNFDVFRLLVVGSEGSSKSDFVHTIVDYEVTHTIAYLNKINKDKYINTKINSTVLHMISESYINTILEPVRHNMSYEQAIENLEFLCIFYTGGWNSIFNEIIQ